MMLKHELDMSNHATEERTRPAHLEWQTRYSIGVVLKDKDTTVTAIQNVEKKQIQVFDGLNALSRNNKQISRLLFENHSVWKAWLQHLGKSSREGMLQSPQPRFGL